MRTILLSGHFGFSNLGCEAIVRGTVEIIRERIPDAHITLISRRTEYDLAVARRDPIRWDKVVPAEGGYRRFSPGWAIQGVGRRRAGLSAYDYAAARLYRDCGVMISIGGDQFSDDYGRAKLFFDSLDQAKRAGARTVIWAASIGPFRDPLQAKAWARIMAKVDLITARENHTVEYLASLGVCENVRLVADPAFLVPCRAPVPPPAASGPNHPLVGIGVSDLLAQSPDYGNDYLEALAQFVRHLVQQCGMRVRLIAHVKEPGLRSDDLAACRRVLQLSGGPPGAEIVGEDYNFAETKFAIGQCDYFVGSRFHSSIASLAMQVPTLTVAYSVKAHGIIGDLFGSEDYLIPVREISLPALLRAFARLRSGRDAFVAQIRQKMPVVQALARRGGEFLAQILSS